MPAGATRADARALENALQRRAIDVSAGRAPARLIGEALDRWQQDAERLKSWDKDVRYRAAIVRKYCTGKTLDQLADVAATIKSDGLANGLTPAAINRYLAILRRVGNLCERWGWTDKALGRRVQLLAGERQRDVLMTPAQVEALAAACPPEAGDFVRLLSMTGLRRSELLSLTPADVVGEAIVLSSATKSGKARTIPLPPAAARIVQARLPWTLTVRTLRKAFEAAREAAGMPDARLHDLRHAYASWLVQAGANIGAVRDLLGHSSLTVTSRYSHLAPEHLRAAVDAAFAPSRVSGGSGHRTKKQAKAPKAA